MADESKSSDRRKFLRQCAGFASSAGVFGLLLASYSRQSEALPSWAIRPPGALPEDGFSAACVRCGLCVRACPFDILHLAAPGKGITVGTPYFVARQGACEMCEDIPCVVACPTGALDHDLREIEDAQMGVAVLTGRDTCYAVARETGCRECYLACPVKGQAITMERHQRGNGRGYFEPTVHTASCTGCGKCEQACVTEEASIKVLPIGLARHDPAPAR
ncbi:MAG: MauM/NapG family ferredoxin-type protein [Burkholderiales bacterium]|nr:MauM/NapG family ferredoxin-type protein [Burkholderiales bacterium]